MSDPRRPQFRAVVRLAALLLAVGAAFGACTSYQRPNGDACLKNEDCLSGYCVSQACGVPNPTLNGSSYGDGGSAVSNDGGSTAMTSDDTGAPDTGSTGDDATSDDSGKVDSGNDANSVGDAANMNFDGDAAEMDASDDATSDAPPLDDAAGDAQDAFNQLSSRRAFVV